MQAFIVNEMKILGSKSVKQLFYDDLRDLVLPMSLLLDAENAECEVPSDPRFQIHQSMESFVARVAHVSCVKLISVVSWLMLIGSRLLTHFALRV